MINKARALAVVRAALPDSTKCMKKVFRQSQLEKVRFREKKVLLRECLSKKILKQRFGFKFFLVEKEYLFSSGFALVCLFQFFLDTNKIRDIVLNIFCELMLSIFCESAVEFVKRICCM